MTPHNDGTTGESNDGKPTDGDLLTRRQTLAIGGTAIGAAALGAGSVTAEDHGQDQDGGADDDAEDDSCGDGGTNTFRVTVTNLTDGQAFTPPAVALHSSDVEAFSVGDPANDAVQALAENGNLEPLAMLVQNVPQIYAAGIGDAPLVPSDDPGGTGHPYYAMLDIEAPQQATHLTFLAMLIATNDGFVGLDTVPLPEDVNESKTLHVSAYDAGTEENTEAWDDLVPPAQALISGNAPEGGATESNPELAEDGVIHPHPGISGEGDLDPAVYGWEEPPAVVHVEKTDGPGAAGEMDEDGHDGDNGTDADGNATDDSGNATNGGATNGGNDSAS